MYFPQIMEICFNTANNELVQFVGIFENKMLFSLDYDGYMYCEPEDLSKEENIVQTIDTRGIPIFPSRKIDDVIILPNLEEVRIIGISPMLPPHTTIFEYLVVNEKNQIWTITEEGYILDKYMFQGRE